MTVKVSGHVIDRLTKKIEKNVNKDEINCIGAYLSDYKHFKILNLLLLHPELLFFGENIHFKQILKSVWKQWRLFCFVLSTSKLGLGEARSWSRPL